MYNIYKIRMLVKYVCKYNVIDSYYIKGKQTRTVYK